ncbi:hypothetical protein [Roseibium sediminicola]|uniref:Aminoglycoside phosphotransferase n=1 Tax=Roseibium sediminicola TaxID=2933272 RepID=A0ABT0H398_9HYPH|nr:hypothetical protein [Roseibium sp. CAU 1639]MCK7616159.1 hypothetical protein [Roseibium sp. CAU 1639]
MAWRAGNIVLNPSPNAAQARCLAETHIGLPEVLESRIQPPVPTPAPLGGWKIDGWVAWHWIEGEPAPERAGEILLAARTYHDLLAHMLYDPVFQERDDPWARADRVAWGEAMPDYPAEYMAMLAPVFAEPVPELAVQRLHGDLTGNVVFAPDVAPGIIDATLYWRPPAFAEAVILVDQGWFAPYIDLTPFADTPELATMVPLAARRRFAD